MAITAKPRKGHKHLGSAGTRKQLVQSNWSCWKSLKSALLELQMEAGQGSAGPSSEERPWLWLCRQRHGHGSLAAGPLLILNLPSICLPWPLAPRPHHRSPDPNPTQSGFLFCFSQSNYWSCDSEHFYVYTQNKKPQNQATIRFCLNFGMWKPHRDACSQSVPSALTQGMLHPALKVCVLMNSWTNSHKTPLEGRERWHCLSPGQAAPEMLWKGC